MADDRGGTVLVTGASGFLGRHLVRRLLDDSHAVTAVCRNPDALNDFSNQMLRVLVCDLENETPSVDPGSTIVHLSAQRISARERRERYFSVNRDATVRFAAKALEAGAARFINVSTALVFGPSNGAPRTEGDPFPEIATRSAYIASKLAAVEDLERMVVKGLPLVTLLPSIVFGPDHPSRPNRITDHIRRILASPVRLHVSATSPRSLAFVDDVVEAMIQAVVRPIPFGSRFLLSGEAVSMEQFEELVLELSGRRKTPVIRIPPAVACRMAALADRLEGRVKGEGFRAQLENLGHEWKFDSQRAVEALGYSATPLRAGIRRTLECLTRPGGNR